MSPTSAETTAPPVEQISTDKLLDLMKETSTVVVDIRPVEAYNGWPQRGETRSGHIRGARSLPLKWFSYIDWIEVVAAKGVQSDHTVVVYGYDEDDISRAARHFQRAGFKHVLAYPGFLEEWSPNHDLPMDQLDRWRQLVSARWLADLLEKNEAPEMDNDKYVLLHAHYRNPAAYHDGHIPEAVQVDTNWLESEETWNRRSPAELETVLSRLGITKDTTVILYGRFAFPDNRDPFPGSSAGHLGAMRCAAILLYAGVKDVRILNGGLQAWLDEGYEVITEETAPVPVESTGLAIPERPEIMIDTPEAKEVIASPGKNLVSVRSWREYIGEVSGYNYIEKTGRIPGSVFGNCGTDAYHMENYRNLDHTVREYHEVERIWAEAGITRDTFNAFYCGTGWRGAEAFMNAWLMGWPKVAIYDGGWFEWSSDPANPVGTGEPAEVAG